MAAVIQLPIKTWGATPDDWTHFSLILGLTADLLPVVSNPHAIKSPASKLEGPGKTPSRYNNHRQMSGIANWTEKQATVSEVDRWSKEPDYGICIQTRLVRALDVDVPDTVEAGEISAAICGHLDQVLPARFRQNSSKFLLAFKVYGDFTKRRIKTAHGVIEFLANGQQFVACGTHTSGVRYEWSGGLPNDFPVLDAAEFEALWLALEKRFGVEPAVEARKPVDLLKRREASDIEHDPVLDYLYEHWEVKGDDRRTGRIDIRCPFEHEHTTESGESATSYFPAGVGGIKEGHFKCQHAHCAHRADSDFLNAIGFYAADFEVIETQPAERANEDSPLYTKHVATLKELAIYRDKNGNIDACRHSVVAALSSPMTCDFDIRWDNFRDEIMISEFGRDEWRPFRDDDYTKVALRLENPRSGFRHIPTTILHEAVGYVARMRSFDSAQLWLDKRKWDGAPRVETFLHRYFGVADSQYSRAVSLYLWTALAGRIIEPGCQVDMVPIILGAQGARKTSAVKAISPSQEFFAELDLGSKDDDQSRLLRGKLVIELGELRGMGMKAADHLKAFITRRVEEWTPKFKEFNTKFPRRCVLIGTTNAREHLPPDDTGYRRWLSVAVEENRYCDPDAIERDRDMLWAEAAVLFNIHGVRWQQAEHMARDEHKQYTTEDVWLPLVVEWLKGSEMGEEPPAARPYLRLHDVMRGAIGLSNAQMNRQSEQRVASVLRALGYQNKTRNGGKAWVKV